MSKTNFKICGEFFSTNGNTYTRNIQIGLNLDSEGLTNKNIADIVYNLKEKDSYQGMLKSFYISDEKIAYLLRANLMTFREYLNLRLFVTKRGIAKAFNTINKNKG